MSDVRDRVEETAGRLAGLGTRLQRNAPLGALTTYRVGGRAALFATLASVAELADVARVVRSTGIDVLVVGRGSNMLVAEDGFAGVAVSLAPFADSIDLDAGTLGPERLITVGSAVLLPVIARRTAAASLTGLEWAVGVPGSVGGGITMNAGGHGSDMAASLVSADLLDISTGARATVGVERLGLRFRGSAIAGHQVVLGGTFRVAHGERRTAEAELAEIVRWRREHQPGGQNAGSVFVNPVPGELAAGELIDRLGLRGHRIGSAEVSTKHANFIQADDGGSAADVRALMEFVRARVAAEFGFSLRSEIRLIGFGDTATPEPGVDLAQPGVDLAQPGVDMPQPGAVVT